MTLPGGGDVAGSAELMAQLERARALGRLGPGPALDHLVHAQAFLDALVGVEGRVIDLGSGGGVPGLPVAVARPDLELVLLDASARRCEFLRGAVEAIGLTARVTVVVGRAEELGRGDLRGTAGAVISRSFGRPSATAECAAPLLALGGRLIVSEPPDAGDRWPAAGVGMLGLSPLGPAQGTPKIQVLEQRKPCPETYPRRDGVPAKRPLF